MFRLISGWFCRLISCFLFKDMVTSVMFEGCDVPKTYLVFTFCQCLKKKDSVLLSVISASNFMNIFQSQMF